MTLITCRKQVTVVAAEDEVKELGVGRGFGAALVLLWGGLLVASIIARSKTSYSDFKILHWSEHRVPCCKSCPCRLGLLWSKALVVSVAVHSRTSSSNVRLLHSRQQVLLVALTRLRSGMGCSTAPYTLLRRQWMLLAVLCLLWSHSLI